MKTIVHVNQHKIRDNTTALRNDPLARIEPVLTVKTYKSNDYAFEVEIDGPCKIVYRPDDPLSCGARVWIETNSKVTTK